MTTSRSVRWKQIRSEIRGKGVVRWSTVVLAKWLLDRALRDGFGSVDAVVLTEGGCCASFDIQSTRWNCGIPGGELTIVVDPTMLGGNCSEWSHLHRNDNRVTDLVGELQARDDAAYAPEPDPWDDERCPECGADVERGQGLCAACVELCQPF